MPLSIVPMPQDVDWWLPRHEAKLLEAREMQTVDIVFLGDSIFQAWETVGANVWQKHYKSRHALNLGFNGDKTENVLWRIAHGALDNIQPKVLVLLIGTNNTGHRQDKAEDTALGIQAVLQAIEGKLPNTKILLLAIFPRSAKPTQRLRLLNEEVNHIIQTYHDGERFFFSNIAPLFLNENGMLNSDVMRDFLHPNASQYERIADRLEEEISELLLSSICHTTK
ncbi:GDSL-type esterase/lipase family protein [Marinomonas sp.]|nr:GDSL-type esterase/lipase family protein [Marinomonas sp.]MDB4838015.1 GDSL-type esterase/lipase family protein [Marinomonas sp.]